MEPIIRPTLFLNERIAQRNIERMADKAKKSGILFRPHFKSHQSAAIGEWFREKGINAITVSSLKMARYFSENGWDDITVAFPVNPLEHELINALSAEISLGLIFESTAQIELLRKNLKNKVIAWVEIDVGDRRSGIWWEQQDELIKVATSLKEERLFQFKGILTHSGYSYNSRNQDQVKMVYKESVLKMNELKDNLQENGFENMMISFGDTPTCSVMDEFPGINEMRPGNFVFYDIMQEQISSCTWQDISIALACPVVALHPLRNEFVIHGGAVHLSKERILMEGEVESWGKICLGNDDGWAEPLEDTFVKNISQEHGIIKTTTEILTKLSIGDIVFLLPVHSCLTADLMKGYTTTDGNQINTIHSNHI